MPRSPGNTGATIAKFSHLLGEVVMALEEGPQDILGATFYALELHDKARGQFYTPYPVCQLMACVMAEVSKSCSRR